MSGFDGFPMAQPQAGFTPPGPQPFTWAPSYAPGSNMGFGDGGMGQMMGGMANMYLQQFLGPTNFLPYGVPAQAANDQLVMREYQQQTMANMRNMASAGTPQVTDFMLGARSFFTGGAPATDLNRDQAEMFAGMVNNPYLKPVIAAGMGGQDNFEAAFFGRMGDPSSLAASANRIGYYRRDSDSGARRMDAQSLEDFSRNLYSTMYQPHGDIEAMGQRARSTVAAEQARGRSELQAAAGDSDSRIVDDTEVANRIAARPASEVNALYESYQPKGTATTVEARAKELVKFDRAVQDAGVLKMDETTVGQLERRARDRSLEEMHGFGAGQAGQIAEQLFQRGLLPQSLGSMSPAERVKMIAGEDVTDTELGNMARDFARRDLTERGDEEFMRVKGKEKEERAYLDRVVGERGGGGYFDRVEKSLKEARSETRPGAAVSPERAEQLLKLDGMSTAASHVDARRAGDVVKQHAAALDAIREIFGDSGNPNAPVPALMAALDHLSQGATHQIGAGKVESTLREMRSTAKSLGMNYTELSNFSAAMGAYGDTLGLSGPTKMAATNNALTALRVMDEGGAFSQTRFGTLNRGEMEQHIGMSVMRAEASPAAKAAAAVMREYKTNAGMYQDAAGNAKEDNELAVIASKMEADPTWDGNYEFNGEKKNFFDQLAESGTGFAYDLAERTGMGRDRMVSFMADADTAQYADHNIGAQMRMQRAEFIQNTGAQFVRGEMSQNMAGTALGANTTEAQQMREKLSKITANKILDTSLLGNEEQLDTLQKELLPEFQKEFEKTIKAANPHLSEEQVKAQAQVQAAEAFSASFGGAADSAEARANLSQIRSDMNTAALQRTGVSLSTLAQREMEVNGMSMSDALGEAQRKRAAEADRSKRASAMFAGTPLARFGDYMQEIGRTGEAPSFQRMMKEIFNVTPESEIMRRLGPELTEEFEAANKKLVDSTVTEQYVDDLEAGKATRRVRQADGTVVEEKLDTAEKIDEEMRALATRDMSDGAKAEFAAKYKTLVTDDKLDKKRDDKIAELNATDEGQKRLREIAKSQFTDITDGTSAEDIVARLQARSDMLGGVTEFREDKILGEGEYTRAGMRQAVLERVGGMARSGYEDDVRSALNDLRALGGDERALATRFESQIGAVAGGALSAEQVADLRKKGLSSKAADTEEFKKALEASGLNPEQQDQLLKMAETNRKAAELQLQEYTGAPLDQRAAVEEAGGRTRPTAPDPAAAPRPGVPDPSAAPAGVSPDGTPAPRPGVPDPSAAPADVSPDGTPAPAGTTPAGGTAPEGTAAPAPRETAAAAGPDAEAYRSLGSALEMLNQAFTDLIMSADDTAAALAQIDTPGGSKEDKPGTNVAQTGARGAPPAPAVAQQRPPAPRPSGGGGGGEITGQLRLLNLHTAIISMRGDPMHVPDGDGGVSIAANSVPSPPYATSAGMA